MFQDDMNTGDDTNTGDDMNTGDVATPAGEEMGEDGLPKADDPMATPGEEKEVA